MAIHMYNVKQQHSHPSPAHYSKHIAERTGRGSPSRNRPCQPARKSSDGRSPHRSDSTRSAPDATSSRGQSPPVRRSICRKKRNRPSEWCESRACPYPPAVSPAWSPIGSRRAEPTRNALKTFYIKLMLINLYWRWHYPQKIPVMNSYILKTNFTHLLAVF